VSFLFAAVVLLVTHVSSTTLAMIHKPLIASVMDEVPPHFRKLLVLCALPGARYASCSIAALRRVLFILAWLTRGNVKFGHPLKLYQWRLLHFWLGSRATHVCIKVKNPPTSGASMSGAMNSVPTNKSVYLSA